MRTSAPVQRQPIAVDEEYAALELGEFLVGEWADDGFHEDLSVCTFSDQLYEEVELHEADYSTKQRNWTRLPEWELAAEKRWEDTHLLDAPHTGYASAQHGRDLGEKPAASAETAWEIAVDTELQRDARLEALAVRQLAWSIAKAFGQPLQPDRTGRDLPQIRGHVRVGPPIAA